MKQLVRIKVHMLLNRLSTHFHTLAQRNMRAIFVAARVDDEDFCHSEFSHCPNIVLWQNEENIWIK